MNYIFPPVQPASLAIHQSAQRFAVRRVYCVGRNYADHARAMGSDPTREPPFFFCKASDADSIITVPAGQVGQMPYPSQTQNLHFETELVVAIGQAGVNIRRDDAAAHIFGYAIGFDMTRRDLQNDMKQGGKPWEVSKAFDHAAPIGTLYPKTAVPDINNAAITLDVNGELRQSGNVSQMIWQIDEVIANLSTYFTLQPGDLIFTGTPAGVGAVQVGDQLHAQIDGLGSLDVKIV